MNFIGLGNPSPRTPAPVQPIQRIGLPLADRQVTKQLLDNITAAGGAGPAGKSATNYRAAIVGPNGGSAAGLHVMLPSSLIAFRPFSAAEWYSAQLDNLLFLFTSYQYCYIPSSLKHWVQ